MGRASRTIATPVLLIGWRAGPSPRRLGAAQTRAKAALRQLGDARECECRFLAGAAVVPCQESFSGKFAGTEFCAGACAIFRCWTHRARDPLGDVSTITFLLRILSSRLVGRRG